MINNTVSITIDQLHISDGNVRNDPGDFSALVASILSVGLFQPMVVTPRAAKGTKKEVGFEVIAGGRRLRALRQLADQYPERATLTYDCVLIDDTSKVTEISLAENYGTRKQMTNPEVYQAFAKLRAERPQATLEDLGAVFGYDVARTARIMRLANLHPDIMTRYEAGEIDDAQAMAYAATEDQKLQIAVYHQLEESARSSHDKNAAAIRRAMKSGDADQAKLIRYVGADAYQAAGGGFEADLFAAEEGKGRVLDPDLLQMLVSQKLAEDRDQFEHQISRNGRVLGEKWGLADLDFSWADAPPQIKQYGYLSTDYELRISRPQRGDLPKPQQKLHDSLTASLSTMIDEDSEPLEGREAEYEKLSAELFELDRARPIILPKKGTVVAVASIAIDGSFDVDLWYADRRAKGAEMPKGATGVASVKLPPTPAEAERATFGLSKDNMQAMMIIRRDVVRNELFESAAAGSSLATDYLLFTQARTILNATKGYSGFYYAGEKQGIANLPNSDDFPGKLLSLVADRPERAAWDERLEAMRAASWASVADPIEGFALFRAAEQRAKDEAAALIAGHMMLATTSTYSDGRTPRMVRELANHIEQEPGFCRWRDGIELNEAFFANFSHKARLRLLDQWGLGDRTKGLKGADTAAFCARVVNCDDADASILGLHPDDLAECVNWLPDFLATGAVEPLPVKDAAEDNTADDDIEMDEVA